MWVVQRLLCPGDQVRGAGLNACGDCPAVHCVKRVDDVNAQAYPVACGTERVQAGLEVRPGEFACSFPIEPKLVRAERGEGAEIFFRAHETLAKKAPDIVAHSNWANPVTFLFQGNQAAGVEPFRNSVVDMAIFTL